MSATHKAHWAQVSVEMPSKRQSGPVRISLATAWKMLHDVLRPQSETQEIDRIANFMPVRNIDEKPWFDFAVYSMPDGAEEAILEISCCRRGNAERFFDVYRKSGTDSVTYFLVNWPERRVLKLFRRDAVSH